MRHTLLAIVIVAGLVVGPGTAGTDIRTCSISLSPAPPIHPKYTYLLATALPDTVLVGPGIIQLTGEPGHVGHSRPGPIYGQRFAVQGIGGHLPPGADSGLMRRAQHVVVVMWDYDGACAPTAWGLSARFASPGNQVFLVLQVRPGADWAGAMPVFDSFYAGQLVYPYAATRTFDGARKPPFEVLTAQELFTLTEALPPLCRWLRDPQGALRQLADAKLRYSSLVSRPPGDNSVLVNELYADEARRGETRRYIRDACAA